jgi:hypothetical protein
MGTLHSPYCSELSRERSEPLSATASRIDYWLLVEYRGLWSRHPVAGSGLSDQVKAHLGAQLRSLEHTRLLFIRRPDRRGRPELIVFVADSRPGDERLVRLELEDYEDLRGIELAREAHAGEGARGEPVNQPLFIVCTHGKHDRCCARQGRPLYEALRDELHADWVWQATHVGGDRFAGNLVCLPEGLYYGRVERPDALAIVDEHLARRIALERYRGRSCYPFSVQAAERAVRVEAGLLGIDDVTLLSVEAVGRSGRRIRFAATSTGDVHELAVVTELGEEVPLTCDATEPKRPRRPLVASHRVVVSR